MRMGGVRDEGLAGGLQEILVGREGRRVEMEHNRYSKIPVE